MTVFCSRINEEANIANLCKYPAQTKQQQTGRVFGILTASALNSLYHTGWFQYLFIISAFCYTFAKYLKGQSLYRQIIPLLFLTAFLAQSLSKPFIVADYYSNTGKYAKNCENKARPKMHCNGKCQMMKKLQQEEKKDQENPERKSENKNEIILSAKSFFATVPTQFLIDSKSKKLLPSSDGKSTDRSFAIFHPPQA